MRQVRGGLGRGLDALIPRGAGIQEIDVDRITPNPAQPRQLFDPDALEELAASIRQHGVLQPIIVVRNEMGYSLVAGERRWRAARLAGLTTIPALVRDAAASVALEIALVENLQRADLAPLEEAAAYQVLIREYGMTQAQVAERLGRSRVAVTNRLRLLSLPPHTRALVAQGVLTEGHARALLGCPDPQVLESLAERVASQQLSVRETEELVRRFRQSAIGNPQSAIRNPEGGAAARNRPTLNSTEEELQRALGTRVQILRSRRGGRIVLYYYDDEQLAGLIESLAGKGEF
jgi:ParB family chromosome partitioning protein